MTQEEPRATEGIYQLGSPEGYHGRIVYFRSANPDVLTVCDMAGHWCSRREMLSAFWENHAHQGIELEWYNLVSHKTRNAIYYVRTEERAIEIMDKRQGMSLSLGLGYVYGLLTYDPRERVWEFTEYAQLESDG